VMLREGNSIGTAAEPVQLLRPAIAGTSQCSSKHTALHLLKEFLLYNLVGLAIALFSLLMLAFGLNDIAAVILGRRLDNPLGVVGSYFVHKDLQHLLGNFSVYVIATLIVWASSMTRPELGYFLEKTTTWKAWNLFVLALMFLVGLVDLLANPLYRLSISSVGMSDLVSALLAIALAHFYLIAFKLANQRARKGMVVFLALIVCGSLVVVQLFNLRDLMVGVNALAHGIGASLGMIIASLLMILRSRRIINKDENLLLIITNTYMINILLIVSGWLLVNSHAYAEHVMSALRRLLLVIGVLMLLVLTLLAHLSHVVHKVEAPVCSFEGRCAKAQGQGDLPIG